VEPHAAAPVTATECRLRGGTISICAVTSDAARWPYPPKKKGRPGDDTLDRARDDADRACPGPLSHIYAHRGTAATPGPLHGGTGGAPGQPRAEVSAAEVRTTRTSPTGDGIYHLRSERGPLPETILFTFDRQACVVMHEIADTAQGGGFPF